MVKGHSNLFGDIWVMFMIIEIVKAQRNMNG